MLCGTVDVTNPDAYDWYKGVVQVKCACILCTTTSAYLLLVMSYELLNTS